MSYELVEKDTGSVLEVTCKDKDGVAINLTGATVKLKYKISGGALQTKTMTINATPTTGKASYQFGVDELTPGYFIGEVEITDVALKVLTSLTQINLEIRTRLA